MLARTPKTEAAPKAKRVTAQKPRKPRPPKKPKPVTYSVEIAELSEASFREVADLLLAEHAEVCTVPLNPAKMAESAYRVMEEGMTLIARDEKGNAVGSIGIAAQGYWYSDAAFLTDAWLYVRKKHRKAGVLQALLNAAKGIAKVRGMPLYVSIINAKRKPKASHGGLVSTVVGYKPAGYTLKVS